LSSVIKREFLFLWKLLKNMTRLDRIEKGIEALQISQLETEAQLKRTDAQLAKTDAQLAKTDAQLARAERILSGIGINLGQAAEDFFASILQKNKKLGKIRFDAVALQLKGHKGKVQDEFDVVMYNGNTVGLVEVKHKVHPFDVELLITRKLPNFKALFPAYAKADFYLGIAGMSIPADAIEIAESAGIAVLRQAGDLLVMNDNLKMY
jgi:hypothetical protein